MVRPIQPANQTINLVVYGQPDAGKTRNWATFFELWEPAQMYLLDVEKGLISLKDLIPSDDLKGCDITNMLDAEDALKWLTSSDEAKEIKLVGVDSLTKLAELCFREEEKKDHSNKYAKFTETYRRMVDFIEGLQYNQGFHVYSTARLNRVEDETGVAFHGPDMPGQQLGKYIMHQFDIVGCQRVFTELDPNTRTPTINRALQLGPAEGYAARNRSGVNLDFFETTHMGDLFKKIAGGN